MTDAHEARTEQQEAVPDPQEETPGAGATAAVAEANGTGPTIEFRGLTLHLPPKLPGSLALQFTTDPDEVPMMVRSFLSAALGEQMNTLAKKIDGEGIAFEDVYGVLNDEVLQPIFEAYNLEPGKSPASPES